VKLFESFFFPYSRLDNKYDGRSRCDRNQGGCDRAAPPLGARSDGRLGPFVAHFAAFTSRSWGRRAVGTAALNRRRRRRRRRISDRDVNNDGGINAARAATTAAGCQRP
jgi:hypothetical protein